MGKAIHGSEFSWFLLIHVWPSYVLSGGPGYPRLLRSRELRWDFQWDILPPPRSFAYSHEICQLLQLNVTLNLKKIRQGKSAAPCQQRTHHHRCWRPWSPWRLISTEILTINVLCFVKPSSIWKKIPTLTCYVWKYKYKDELILFLEKNMCTYNKTTRVSWVFQLLINIYQK